MIELTNPVNEKEIENDKIGILELSNPIGDEKNEIFEEDDPNQDEKNEFLINDKQIKRAVRKAINALPRKQLDEIINAELTKIIQERITSKSSLVQKTKKLMLERYYQPDLVESKIYEKWENEGDFKSSANTDDAYSIVIPPPNVTGTLHMGHALNNSLQDIFDKVLSHAGQKCISVKID